MSDEKPGVSRRDLLIGAGVGVGVGLAAGAILGSTLGNDDGSHAGTGNPAHPPAANAVAATGKQQAGIARPATPQARGLLAVFGLTSLPTREALAAQLAALGQAIVACTTAQNELFPDGVGDLTITIGLGPQLVKLAGDDVPGAAALPLFAGDDGIPSQRTGGDLLIAVHATDAAVLRPAVDYLAAAAPSFEPQWSEQLYRAAGTGTVTRNPLGYLDGIIVPHSEEELAKSVWIASGAAAGGTICVVRRLVLDIAGFGDQPLATRDAIVGRHRVDGTPLSGGSRDDQVDLHAKTADGEYLTPAHSHARAAHPSFTGSGLMLRRGYAFDTDGERGLMFICFQNQLDTFVKTQRRLDELDDLMKFATPTASAAFLILPGFTSDRPLGAALFAS